ncbi:MAG: hypothetical protein LKM43_04535 [Wolbachia endosymbiont of Penenirmus auritus]|nr:hypothetical protein [Wolbachia endosymbiont of Penenirmus auritus]
MSSSTSEEKKNPIVTLKAQAKKFDFSKLRADKNNTGANSGHQTYLDIKRMNFVINKKSIDSALTTALIKGAEQNELEESWSEHCKYEKTPDRKTDQYKKKFEEFYNLGTKYTNLLSKEKAGNYRPFAKQVFIELFEYAGAEVPSDSILEELITSCNQLGYEGNLHFYVLIPAFAQNELLVRDLKKTINIGCNNPNNVKVRSDMILPILFQKSDGTLGEKVCDLSSSLEFTLESQDGKDGVTYKNSKLSLTVPERLKDYNIGDKSLFDIIKECFQKLCEKLGFFKIKIEHNLGDPMEVSSCVTSLDVDPLSNKYGVPGVKS